MQYLLDYSSDGPTVGGLPFAWPHLAVQPFLTCKSQMGYSYMEGIALQLLLCVAPDGAEKA